MKGIKYVNLIGTSPVIIEIREVLNGELAVSVNNILVHMLHHTAFLAVDTQPYVLLRRMHAYKHNKRIIASYIKYLNVLKIHQTLN